MLALRDDYVTSLVGKLLDHRHFNRVITGADAELIKPNGHPLLVFRYRALPSWVCRQAWPALLRAGNVNDHRWNLNSGVAGFFDRPEPRPTGFTLNNPLGWAALQPFIRASDALYRRELPEVYARQMEAVKRADPRWVIPRTAFTTMTVNRDAVFPAHRDSGNLPGTFAAMSAIHAGTYDGFYLVFPKYKVAVDLRSRDVLLADVSEVHGNSPVQAKGAWTRVSTVLYFRSGFLP